MTHELTAKMSPITWETLGVCTDICPSFVYDDDEACFGDTESDSVTDLLKINPSKILV